MNVNFIEGVLDKSEFGLRAILLAQLRVRVGVAVPVIVADLVLFLTSPNGIPLWFLGLTAGYCLYALSPYSLIRNGSYKVLYGLLIATAVLDPLVLSVWIALTGQTGGLIAGFYLFTTLGFGFRTGRPLMHLCQIASIAGFSLVLAFNQYWQHHGVFWAALLVPIIVVPMYAGKLITTLREARDHAEQQSRGKSELLAKVSHELRTPLTGIVASAELLAVESREPSVTRRTQTILSLSDTLLNEINDLLDAAKYNAKAVELSYAPIDLPQQVATLRATFETMAARKGVAFLADVDPAITDRVETDTHGLDRILLNLVGNAIKFTENGSVKFAVDLLVASESDYRLRFSVTDTGIGIPESFRAEIFEPFSQVNRGSARSYGGTGLGLTLSRQIVELMGGELRFESNLGQGSRFWFDLVLKRAGPVPAGEVEAEATAIVTGRRVLVVDDNVTNLVLLKELLEIDRHEVTTCTSGMAALELLTRHDFDLVLLDYNLGDMDGVRVLQTYRFGRLHPVPALFLTADATAQTATRLREAGGAGTLYKPVNLTGIRKALAELVLPAVAPAPVTSVPPAAEMSRPVRPVLKVVPISPLDAAVIEDLRSVNTRPEFLGQLLAHAESDIARACQQVLEALACRNYATMRTAAHALKGVSANVGAIRLVTLSTSLMSMASDELSASAERLAMDVRETSRTTINALRQTVAASGATSMDNAGSLHLD
ncbi:MAG TPA: ATP-binding protein [Rudaea sp.]|nr:ATP-binding protein [Rudaea sp.]